MTQYTNPVYLIFDYDGTLHDCSKIYNPAFRHVYGILVQKGLVENRDLTEQEINRWLGYSPVEMWRSFLPSLPPEQTAVFSRQIGDEMLHAVQNGLASLYDGTEDVLQKLCEQNFRLLFLSNCKRAYMDCHRSYFRLDRFFSGYYCGEDYHYIAKYQIFHQIRNEFPGSHIVIGDRFHDMEIAEKHHLKSIGCAYGYGTPEELSGANAVITDIRQLPDTIRQL